MRVSFGVRTLAAFTLALLALAHLGAPALAATCTINRNSYTVTITGFGTINGTSGDDVILGSSGKDVIKGNGGDGLDDLCNGQAGTDSFNTNPHGCESFTGIP